MNGTDGTTEESRPGTVSEQVSIVTGGTSGIGRAAAITLAHRGAKVAVVGRDQQRMRATLADVRRVAHSPEQAMGLRLDVQQPDDMEQMREDVLSAFGRIDILVAAAGVGGPTGGDEVPRMVLQLSENEWDDVIGTNLRGIFLSNRAVLPVMIEQRAGSIVNVSSSRGATMGLPFAAAYAASKHAMFGLTQCLREEVAPYGIRVQAILPDVTQTPLMTGAEHLCPEGLLTPEQVAETILKLLSISPDAFWRDPIMAPFRIIS